MPNPPHFEEDLYSKVGIGLKSGRFDTVRVFPTMRTRPPYGVIYPLLLFLLISPMLVDVTAQSIFVFRYLLEESCR